MKGNKTLVVIGGGASGIFCAVNAARMSSNLKVIVLEKSSKLLSKVRISGGGRCNVTNACDDIVEMSGKYPRGKNFVKKSFHDFFTSDTINWFEERGVHLKKEPDGRIFPVSNKSETIIECLMREASLYGVEMILNTQVNKIKYSDEHWILDVDQMGNARQFMSDFVFIATGALQKPEQYHWLTALGHSFEKPVPSLFTFNLPDQPITSLMGISLPSVTIKIPAIKKKETGALLITHWGLSGPAVLRLSAWSARELNELNYHFLIHVQWLPEYHDEDLKNEMVRLRHTHGNEKLHSRSCFSLPQRLWDFLLMKSQIPVQTRWADLQSSQSHKLVQLLLSDTYQVLGKTTFKDEFVTAGGITLSEIEPQTMKSKLCSGLYFGGELMNVDGITGGYNFQHAWTSGYIAAKNIAKISNGNA